MHFHNIEIIYNLLHYLVLSHDSQINRINWGWCKKQVTAVQSLKKNIGAI